MVHLLGNALHPSRISLLFEEANPRGIPRKRFGGESIYDVDRYHRSNLPVERIDPEYLTRRSTFVTAFSEVWRAHNLDHRIPLGASLRDGGELHAEDAKVAKGERRRSSAGSFSPNAILGVPLRYLRDGPHQGRYVTTIGSKKRHRAKDAKGAQRGRQCMSR